MVLIIMKDTLLHDYRSYLGGGVDLLTMPH